MIDEQQKASTYDDAITFLYNLQKFGIKLGLTNMYALSESLGRPEQAFSSIHVAGTNGKGSTSSMIASILEEEGLKVGLFLSPHFKSFTERISINKQQISERTCLELTNYIRDLIYSKSSELKPTFFEFVTAMAFYYFAQRHVDYAVIETGMGGRLDATNIISPSVSVITSISREHTQYLGSDISEIASEKAGIIKFMTPVVTSAQGRALKVIEKKAFEKDADIHIYNKDFSYTDTSNSFENQSFSYSGYSTYKNLSLPLLGKYQLINASTAIRVYEILYREGHLKQSSPERSVNAGLARVKLQGRCEIVSHNPTVIIDGAHNPEAAQALCHTIQEKFPHKGIILVIGIMSDKDIQGILAPLSSLSCRIIFTQAQGQRAGNPENLMDCLSPSDREKSVVIYTVKDALEKALSECTNKNIVLITGSFYTAGEAMEALSGEGILSSLRE